MEEGKDIKRELDAAEFLEDSGLLFEINRLVLHPIGYHMGIPVVDGKRTLRVLDYADVEGGVAFGAIEWKDGKEKQRAFNKKREVVRRISDRMRSLGCIVQESVDGPRSSRSKNPGERRPSPPRRRQDR